MDALSNGLNSLQVSNSNDAYNGLTEEEREQTLIAELDQVRQVNDVMEGVLESIDTAEVNLETVLTTTKNANKVLDTWVSILSQTEHTKNLLFNEQWHGATKDDELQQEREVALQQKREKERQERERKQREQEVARKKQHELDERKRLKNEAMQRRIYGRRAVSSSGASTTSSSTVRSATSGTTGTRTTRPNASSISTSNTTRNNRSIPRQTTKSSSTTSATTNNNSRIRAPSNTGVKRTAAHLR